MSVQEIRRARQNMYQQWINKSNPIAISCPNLLQPKEQGNGNGIIAVEQNEPSKEVNDHSSTERKLNKPTTSITDRKSNEVGHGDELVRKHRIEQIAVVVHEAISTPDVERRAAIAASIVIQFDQPIRETARLFRLDARKLVDEIQWSWEDE